MIGDRFTGVAPAMLILVAFFLPTTTAKTPTLQIPTNIPTSCIPLATVLGESPPPTDGKALDNALIHGLEALYSSYAATATAASRPNKTSVCDYIISTQIPSATPSVTSALSSYVSAAGIWLEDHGLDTAKSLLGGDCSGVVQGEDYAAQAELDFVINFGECYTLLAWDQRTSSHLDATTTDVTTTDARTTKTNPTSTATSSRSGSAGTITSPTSQPSETNASTNAGGRREGDLFWILATVMCVTLFYS
ncbi:hypothetical protein F5B18DRAFT_637042 [Nemania serpens]|nr:hypothetical protein F5B18DRAFT_637042 [Nemania serpens]